MLLSCIVLISYSIYWFFVLFQPLEHIGTTFDSGKIVFEIRNLGPSHLVVESVEFNKEAVEGLKVGVSYNGHSVVGSGILNSPDIFYLPPDSLRVLPMDSKNHEQYGILIDFLPTYGSFEISYYYMGIKKSLTIMFNEDKYPNIENY
ncbi:hypothetical protein [Mangrovibacillus cuniculi]|uniref:Uncharacterized protein n=1 Tax=Mangrovibacillus cuniculi TaxID=2593652 RepID=A0A7S8CBK8_9BACI|nr:hypothetical protein [Mangrovibacillus cuniculi]QPC46965.1 hypothetical protein G8O30_08320 [Mangrovibacillus cuniculi]